MTRSCATSWCAYEESYEERPTWAAPMTLTYWCIFWHFAEAHGACLSYLRGFTHHIPKDESRGKCILFLDLGWRTNFRKSLRSWRLGGDLWVLKLATRFIRNTCVFCFRLGLKYRQSNIDVGHLDLLLYAWWFLCPWLCFLCPRQLD